MMLKKQIFLAFVLSLFSVAVSLPVYAGITTGSQSAESLSGGGTMFSSGTGMLDNTTTGAENDMGNAINDLADDMLSEQGGYGQELYDMGDVINTISGTPSSLFGINTGSSSSGISYDYSTLDNLQTGSSGLVPSDNATSGAVNWNSVPAVLGEAVVKSGNGALGNLGSCVKGGVKKMTYGSIEKLTSQLSAISQNIDSVMGINLEDDFFDSVNDDTESLISLTNSYIKKGEAVDQDLSDLSVISTYPDKMRDINEQINEVADKAIAVEKLEGEIDTLNGKLKSTTSSTEKANIEADIASKTAEKDALLSDIETKSAKIDRDVDSLGSVDKEKVSQAKTNVATAQEDASKAKDKTVSIKGYANTLTGVANTLDKVPGIDTSSVDGYVDSLEDLDAIVNKDGIKTTSTGVVEDILDEQGIESKFNEGVENGLANFKVVSVTMKSLKMINEIQEVISYLETAQQLISLQEGVLGIVDTLSASVDVVSSFQSVLNIVGSLGGGFSVSSLASTSDSVAALQSATNDFSKSAGDLKKKATDIKNGITKTQEWMDSKMDSMSSLGDSPSIDEFILQTANTLESFSDEIVQSVGDSAREKGKSEEDVAAIEASTKDNLDKTIANIETLHGYLNGGVFAELMGGVSYMGDQLQAVATSTANPKQEEAKEKVDNLATASTSVDGAASEAKNVFDKSKKNTSTEISEFKKSADELDKEKANSSEVVNSANAKTAEKYSDKYKNAKGKYDTWLAQLPVSDIKELGDSYDEHLETVDDITENVDEISGASKSFDNKFTGIQDSYESLEFTNDALAQVNSLTNSIEKSKNLNDAINGNIAGSMATLKQCMSIDPDKMMNGITNTSMGYISSKASTDAFEFYGSVSNQVPYMVFPDKTPNNYSSLSATKVNTDAVDEDLNKYADAYDSKKDSDSTDISTLAVETDNLANQVETLANEIEAAYDKIEHDENVLASSSLQRSEYGHEFSSSERRDFSSNLSAYKDNVKDMEKDYDKIVDLYKSKSAQLQSLRSKELSADASSIQPSLLDEKYPMLSALQQAFEKTSQEGDQFVSLVAVAGITTSTQTDAFSGSLSTSQSNQPTQLLEQDLDRLMNDYIAATSRMNEIMNQNFNANQATELRELEEEATKLYNEYLSKESDLSDLLDQAASQAVSQTAQIRDDRLHENQLEIEDTMSAFSAGILGVPLPVADIPYGLGFKMDLNDFSTTLHPPYKYECGGPLSDDDSKDEDISVASKAPLQVAEIAYSKGIIFDNDEYDCLYERLKCWTVFGVKVCAYVYTYLPGCDVTMEYKEPIAQVEVMGRTNQSHLSSSMVVSPLKQFSAKMSTGKLMDDGESLKEGYGVGTGGNSKGFKQTAYQARVYGTSPTSRFLSNMGPLEATYTMACDLGERMDKWEYLAFPFIPTPMIKLVTSLFGTDNPVLKISDWATSWYLGGAQAGLFPVPLNILYASELDSFNWNPYPIIGGGALLQTPLGEDSSVVKDRTEMLNHIFAHTQEGASDAIFGFVNGYCDREGNAGANDNNLCIGDIGALFPRNGVFYQFDPRKPLREMMLVAQRAYDRSLEKGMYSKSKIDEGVGKYGKGYEKIEYSLEWPLKTKRMQAGTYPAEDVLKWYQGQANKLHSEGLAMTYWKDTKCCVRACCENPPYASKWNHVQVRREYYSGFVYLDEKPAPYNEPEDWAIIKFRRYH